MARTIPKQEKALIEEVARLRGALREAQKEGLLTNSADIPGTTIKRYITALADLAIERGAPGRNPDAVHNPNVGSDRTPDRTPAWADDLFGQETRHLARRAEFIEDWIDKPRPVKRGPGKRCASCGNGLHKGAKFCSGCGEESK